MTDAPSPPTDLGEYSGLFEGHGETDRDYLSRHYRRFLRTFYEFNRRWSPQKGARMLDIGAHWLHQSVLYARAGYDVTAAEFGEMLQQSGIRSLAEAYRVRLHRQRDLGEEHAFAGLESDSFDVVLFCEVLEHLACNPVGLWKEVHRVLARGGRIVLTTPNYYFWKSRVRGLLRLMSGDGAGVSVADVLCKPTHAHHWKEYSVRELKRFFALLSPDFRINRIFCLADRFSHAGPLGRTIYTEIDLPTKRVGIVIEPEW